MDRPTQLILIARLVQILFALIAMGFSIALGISQWYYQEAFGITAPTYCSAVIAVGGTFGLFALKRRPDSASDAKLFLLVLYIDAWAWILSVIGGALVWVNGNSYYWDVQYNSVVMIPGIFSHFNTFVISLLLFRTLRLWWKRLLYPVPNEIVHNPVVYENHQQYVQPVYVVNDSKADPLAQPVYIVNESRTNAPSPRPLSAVTESTLGTATLGHRPSINQGYPSRVPSYTSRAEHARLEKQ